jgi:hypothetical protein
MGDLTPFPGLAGYVDILGQRHELDKLMNTQWWKPNPSTLETDLPRVILRKILSESMMRRFAVIIVATNIMRYLIILY